MKAARFFAVLAATIAAGAACAQDAEKQLPTKLATAPSGAFHIESDPLDPTSGGWWRAKLWIAPSAKSSERVPLCEIHKEASASTPLAFISPDERWIFCAVLGAPALFRRHTDATEVRFEAAPGEKFGEMASRFFSDEDTTPDDELEHVGPSEALAVRFVAWSRDSARLLLCFDGSSGGRSVSSWLGYFHTGRGEFELTQRLGRSNADAHTRWKRRQDQWLESGIEKVPGGGAFEHTRMTDAPLDAESVGEEGPVSPAKQMFEQADKRLGEIYARALEQTPAAQRVSLRREQRAWLVQRDTEAWIHALQSWSPFAEAKALEGKALATEKRNYALEEWLNAKSTTP